MQETCVCVCVHMCVCVCACLVTRSCPTLCDPMDYSPPVSSVHEDSPPKNIGVGCHVLLQGIFSTEGPNPGLPHYRRFLYHLNYQGSLLDLYNRLKITYRVED